MKTKNEWPDEGVIEYKEISLNYSGGQAALKDVEFKTKPKEKVIQTKTFLALYPTEIENVLSGSTFKNEPK